VRPKFNAALKASITADWAACFPALGVLKPLWLARRVGPMLQGIRLERDAGNDNYRPMAFTHCLCLPSDSLTLGTVQTLRTKKTNAPDSVSVPGHPTRHVEAAARLASQSLLPFDRPFSVAELVAALQRHGTVVGVTQPIWAITDAVAILCWAEDRAQAEALIVRSIAEAKTWPLGLGRRRDWWVEWEAKLRGLLERHDYEQTIEAQIGIHALSALPSCELQRDEPPA
jgi:hypothetical protein